jgi:NADH-quinone oxidoreductase subunit L
MTENLHLWVIPILPLIGAAINGFLGRRFSRQTVVTVALAASGASFVMALWVASQFSSASAPYVTYVAPWIRAGNFQVDFSFYLDQLSFVMLLVVTGVGLRSSTSTRSVTCGRNGFYRFLCLLELVHVFMLTCTRKELLAHVHWVGRRGSRVVSSDWFLVHEGFGCFRWKESIHHEPDWGLWVSIALFLLIKHFGSLDYTQVFESVSKLPAETTASACSPPYRTAVDGWRCRQVCADSTLCLASDAMEGPTPVSA